MDYSSLDDQFNCLSIKFIFICEDSTELSSLLNELNGLDYKKQITTSQLVQFLESLPKIPTTSDPKIIVKALCLIKQLISKQKIHLPENVSNKIILWILKCCDQKLINLFFCEAFDALTLLFKTNAFAVQQVGQHFTFIYQIDGNKHLFLVFFKAAFIIRNSSEVYQ